MNDTPPAGTAARPVVTGTSDYYEQHAAEFFADTHALDMEAFYRRFLPRIPAGGSILDAGCGSGRDAKAFSERGYRVVAFDASPALARLASAHAGIPVHVRGFQDVREHACYDGVWACASLLHVPLAAVPGALGCLWHALKPGGVLYFSFKLGIGEGERKGRHFTDAHDALVQSWIAALPDAGELAMWHTDDARPGRDDRWLNAIVTRLSATDRASPRRAAGAGTGEK
ncbi:MAG: class I SAM-dependent methyltransferase [Candidatus Schekmanbacteria bacterium]|nr:class I SAM-dependent methyltransferase [Candidatus Schekmanbacteria bacterium]